MPEGWHVASSTAGTHKYYAPRYKMYSTGRSGACDFCTLVITSSISILNPYFCIVRFYCFSISWISSLCFLQINTSSADVVSSSGLLLLLLSLSLSLSLSLFFNNSNFIYRGSRCIALAWLHCMPSTVRTYKFCLNIICTVAVFTSMVNGALLSRHGSFSAFGWRRRPLDIEDNGKYME